MTRERMDEDTKEESYRVWARLITVGLLVFLIWFFLFRTRDGGGDFDPASKNQVIIDLATMYYTENLSTADSDVVLSDFQIDWTTVEYGVYTAVATSSVGALGKEFPFETTWQYTLRWDSMDLKEVYYQGNHYTIE